MAAEPYWVGKPWEESIGSYLLMSTFREVFPPCPYDMPNFARYEEIKVAFDNARRLCKAVVKLRTAKGYRPGGQTDSIFAEGEAGST